MYKLDNNVEWTDELKQAFKTGTTRAKIIYGENQEINETNMLKNLELKDTQYVPNLGIIGQACSKELSFSFVNSEGINLENQEITLKIGAEYNGDVYYINYGNFIVCEAPKNDKTNDVTSIVANDYMIKFDVPYEDTITYPCTLKDLVENICTAVGVELGSEDFANSDFVVIDNQFEGKTAKEVIKNVAKCAFSWARIGQDNKLYFDFEPSEEIEIVGSNFTITNANSMQQAEITEIRGNTSQEGTPTPSSPVEVETVSGDNNIVVSNKNILGNEWEIGSISTATGLDLARTDRIRTIGYIPVEPSLSYTLSNGENTNTCLFFEYDINKQFIKQTPTNWASVPYTITTSANTHYLRIIFQAINISIVENVQLEKGTVATDYTEHEGSSYRVDLGGKNLFSTSMQTANWRTTVVSAEDNTTTLSPTQNGSGYITYTINNIKPSTTYIIAVKGTSNYSSSFSGRILVYSYDSNNTQIGSSSGHYCDGTYKTIEITTASNISYFSVLLYSLVSANDNWETIQTTYSNIMVAEGTDTTYSPYTDNPIELCKIGNYQDKLYYDSGKWYIEKNIGKLVLNGSENWKASSTAGVFLTNTAFPSDVALRTQPPFAYSTHFNYQYYSSSIQTSIKQGEFSWSGAKLLVLKDTSLTSLTDLTTWLGNNNVTVYYVLATPTYTEITDTYLLNQLNGILDIELYEDLCYVDWVGSIEPTMKLKYFSSEVEGEAITLKDYKANNFKHADEYYGGLNRVGYADSDIEGQEEYVENATDIEENGLKDLFIYDNLFAYTEAKRQTLVQAATNLLGFKYMPIQEMDLKGLIYLDCTDFLKITDADEDSTVLYSRCFDHTIKYQGYVSDNIKSLATTTVERTYENLNAPTLANSRTQIIVDKANKKINLAVADSQEAIEKATELEISVDGISSTVNSLVDVTITRETSVNNLAFEDINLSQPIQLIVRPLGENIATLYPRDTLYPSDTLYLTNKTIQFKRTYTEIDSETWQEVEKTEYIEYEIPNSLLYYDSNTYDEFQLDYNAKTCKIIKKLDYDANGNIYVLATPQTLNYEYPYIELGEGDYEISIPGYENVYISATLMKKNETTTKFATQVQVDTQVKQTENEVMISVNQKVSEDEFTKAEIIARINSEGQSEAKISADSVSLEGYTTINGGFAVDEQGNASIANGSVSINDAGIQLANGRSIVGGNGMLTQFQYSATGMLGHVQGASTVNQRIALYIPIYIPQNFVITDAKLFLTHTYARVYEYTGSGYVEYACYARNVKLYKTTERGVAQISGGYFDAVAPSSAGTEVYNFGNTSGKTFSSNSVEKITVSNIKDSLDEGMQYLYLADYVNNPSDWVTSSRMTGVVDASLYVTGYLENNIE